MKYIERLLLLVAAVILAGTNRCQEDYFFAVNSRVSITPTGTVTDGEDGTATPTSTPGTPAATPTDGTDEDDDIIDDDEDDETNVDPTPVVTMTPTVTATATQIPSTATAVALVIARKQQSVELLGALQGLDSPEEPEIVKPTISSDAVSLQAGASGLNQNWLGNMYKDNDASEDELRLWETDSDLDGYADALENALGSDPVDPSSTPAGLPRTRLENRIIITDDNFTEEDGSYQDSDADGLSNELELAIGSDPLLKDTDGDGITDFREYSIGGDPLISDFPVKGR